MNHWLIKSEPSVYSWDKLVEENKVVWDGVRNYAARNNLRAMKKGDLAFFYHSNEGLDIVGIAKVVKEAYQDPTTDDTAWSVVEFAHAKALKKSVTLTQMKADKQLASMQLIKIGRLSVSAVTKDEFDRVLKLAETNFP
jgi:predicted RNA-binding protein with PUA-like domain